MQRIRQGMAGYRIPTYMEDILTSNYCPYFIRMSMVREKDEYSFSYRPDRYIRLDIPALGLYEKLLLIRTLIAIAEAGREYLIRPETYLLEPELIYSSGGGISADSIRIMFYPDIKKMAFIYKLILFCDRIRNDEKRDERELFGQMRSITETGDLNKLKIFLDKNILRMESRLNNNMK